MKETYTYHGHSIDLDLRSLAHARIRWTYFIDEDYCSQGTMESFLVEAVRARALVLAHRAIDVLDSMKPGNAGLPSSASIGPCVGGTMMDPGSQRFAASR